MELVECTPTKLVFQQTPNRSLPMLMLQWLQLLIFAPLVTVPLVFMGFVLFTLGDEVVTCGKLELGLANCQYKKRYLITQKVESQDYYGITAARYQREEERDSDGDILVDHYVILMTQNGELPVLRGAVYVNGVRGNPKRAQRFANGLNQFLQSDQAALTLSYQARLTFFDLFILLLGGAFLVMGALFLLSKIKASQSQVMLVLDQQSQQLEHRVQFRKTLEKHSFPLREIGGVFVVQGGSCCTAVLVMRSGERYPVTRSWGSCEKANQVAARVGEFLGIDVTQEKRG